MSLGIVYSKLKKQTLVKTMESFVFGKTQVLLSTSIIESGIDIGQANTIIINNAHLFGLSQLYQLRGRVGRSPVQAFAWFLIPQKKQTPFGEKRLKTIIKNTALGAGYYIALSDLDIRGSGSLFGYKQSGDGGVGFELYTKLKGLFERFSQTTKFLNVCESMKAATSSLIDEGPLFQIHTVISVSKNESILSNKLFTVFDWHIALLYKTMTMFSFI